MQDEIDPGKERRQKRLGALVRGLRVGQLRAAERAARAERDAKAARELGGGVDLSENGQAMDAVREVGPGSHYLGCAHTQANFESAFYRSSIADNNSFEQWESEGSLDAFQRANVLYKKLLADYEAPAIDPGIDEALQAFIAAKKASMPDAFV